MALLAGRKGKGAKIMDYIKLLLEDEAGIAEMSQMATEIVREHFDPLIGKEQNDYMINMFQTEEAIKEQIIEGYQYFFVRENDKNLGFVAFYKRENAAVFE